MFFKYPIDEPLDIPPRPVYAHVDQIEELDDGDKIVLLDCVEAEMLDEIETKNSILHLSDPGQENIDNRISIIGISAKDLGISKDNPDEHEEWYHLELGELGEGPEAQQFHNLFMEPTERGVINVRKVSPEEKMMLKQLAGWENFEGSPMEDIEKTLNNIGQFDAVAIYDVGQGAATALLSRGAPVLYFDIGGSTTFNSRSFPDSLQKFCTTYKPPVVLSHWDWDHWSSAIRDKSLLKWPWILPIQSQAGDLGVVHARFLAMLRQRKTEILWWDHNPQRIISGQHGVILFQAGGSKRSRNESGLALSITQNNRHVLLPGDASIKNVCTHSPRIDYLMVPHHGGVTNINKIPSQKNRNLCHLIYSYGIGNHYQHPLPKIVRAYRRYFKKNAHTPLRDRSGFGHIGIDLNGKQRSLSQSPCFNTRCQLAIRQWL